MAMVSDTHKFIYVSGGRNATGATRAGLMKIDGMKHYEPAQKNKGDWTKFNKHMPARYIKKIVGDKTWEDYYKFTFVRNPYSWVISSFFFWVKIGMHKNPPNSIMRMSDFQKVVDYYQTPDGRRHDEHSPIRSQHSFICDDNRNIMVDYVGKFENLQNDFNNICDHIGVGEIELSIQNSSLASKNDWKDHYRKNKEAKALVDHKWGRDIKTFGYLLEL